MNTIKGSFTCVVEEPFIVFLEYCIKKAFLKGGAAFLMGVLIIENLSIDGNGNDLPRDELATLL